MLRQVECFFCGEKMAIISGEAFRDTSGDS
jgi:hypothetical protein